MVCTYDPADKAGTLDIISARPGRLQFAHGDPYELLPQPQLRYLDDEDMRFGNQLLFTIKLCFVMRLCMETPLLTTERLILRPIRIEDAPRIQENFPHWEMLKYMAVTIPWPYPADGAEDFLENVALKNMAAGKEHHWAITERNDPLSLHIGSISLYPSGIKESRGFWMAQAYQGRGYIKEAVVAVNDFAFETVGMEKMILRNAKDNIGSRRMKVLAGAKLIETFEDDFVSGKQTGELWHLTADTWRANRHKFLSQPIEGAKVARKPDLTSRPS